MKNCLIINADDFGYNTQQNEAVRELLSKGLVTSTSVMTVAPCAKQCRELESEKYSVGVHLTLNSDEESSKWYSHTESRALGGKEGLPCDIKKLTFGVRHRDIRAELEAQYGFVISMGLTPDHADNHCGTLYGINARRFYIDAFDFCQKHSLPFRFPKTPGFIERQLGRKLPKPLAGLQNMIVRQGEKRNVAMPDDIVSNPWSIERINDYETLRAYYIDAVDNCIDGVTEMFLHPAKAIDDSKSPWMKRVFEYELLRSGDLLQRAHEKGIEVVSWKIFSK